MCRGMCEIWWEGEWMRAGNLEPAQFMSPTLPMSMVVWRVEAPLSR